VDQYRVMKQPTVFDAVERIAKPVIAAINGFCLGGGMELALACDIRIASTSARFGQPEVNLGIIPGGGGTQRLPRIVGLGAASRMILTGDLIDAQEALRLRLVEEVVAPDALMTRAKAIAETIAAKSPVAVAAAKEATRAAVSLPLEEGLKLDPVQATFAGDNRYNDQLPNTLTDEYQQQLRAYYQKYHDLFNAVDRSSLPPAEQLNVDALLWECEIGLAGLKFRTEFLPINQFHGLNIFVATWAGGTCSHRPAANPTPTNTATTASRITIRRKDVTPRGGR
jgi:hypothetical protein